jgi:WD domain, G-beta repeat
MKYFYILSRLWILIVLLLASSDVSGQEKHPYLAHIIDVPSTKLAYTTDGSRIACYENANSPYNHRGGGGFMFFNKLINEKYDWKQWNEKILAFALLPNNSHYAIAKVDHSNKRVVISIKDIKKNAVSLEWYWKYYNYDNISTLNVSPYLNLLACTHLNDIKIWDYTNSKEVSSFSTRNSYIRASDFSPDGLLFATVGDLGIHLLDIYAGKGQYVDGNMSSIAFSPNGQNIAAASRDGYVQTWDLNNYVLTNLYIKTNKEAQYVIYSPDGLFIAIQTEDAFQIYSVKNKELVYAYNIGKTHLMANIGFSPDGRFFSYGFVERSTIRRSDLYMLNSYQILGKYMYAADFARDSINSGLFVPKSEFESAAQYESRKQQAEKYKWTLIEKYGQLWNNVKQLSKQN